MFKLLSSLLVFIILFSCADTATESIKTEYVNGKMMYYMTVQQGNYPDSNYSGCKDTYIYSNNPANNYGAAITMKSGTDNSGINRCLIGFDFSHLPLPAGSIVEKAYLSVYVDSYIGNFNEYAIYSVNQLWDEGGSNGSSGASNWNNRTSSNIWISSGGDFVDCISNRLKINGYGFMNFELDKNYIQKTASSLYSKSNTFMLKTVNEDITQISYILLHTKENPDPYLRPKLAIYYTLP